MPWRIATVGGPENKMRMVRATVQRVILSVESHNEWGNPPRLLSYLTAHWYCFGVIYLSNIYFSTKYSLSVVVCALWCASHCISTVSFRQRIIIFRGMNGSRFHYTWIIQGFPVWVGWCCWEFYFRQQEWRRINRSFAICYELLVKIICLVCDAIFCLIS